MAKEKTNIEVLHSAIDAMKDAMSRLPYEMDPPGDQDCGDKLTASIAELTALIGKARVDREVFGNALAAMQAAGDDGFGGGLANVGFYQAGAFARKDEDAEDGYTKEIAELHAKLDTSIAELTTLIGDK